MPSSILEARDEAIFLVTTHAKGVDAGMIATWITQASMSTRRPRIVAVFSPKNRTTELIEMSGSFAVQLLTEAQLELVPRFGLSSSRDVDKFQGLSLSRTPLNCPIVADSKGWVECQVVTKLDSGDRFVYLADIVARSPVQTQLNGLQASVAFARLPRDAVEALAKQRAATMERDNAIVDHQP
jgi:flavin reductase (DIM6/NTAB) family NADH-FMN oxidoreductase RutF